MLTLINKKNVDIDMFTDKAYDYSQQRIILDSLIEGLDVSLENAINSLSVAKSTVDISNHDEKTIA